MLFFFGNTINYKEVDDKWVKHRLKLKQFGLLYNLNMQNQIYLLAQ